MLLSVVRSDRAGGLPTYNKRGRSGCEVRGLRASSTSLSVICSLLGVVLKHQLVFFFIIDDAAIVKAYNYTTDFADSIEKKDYFHEEARSLMMCRRLFLRTTLTVGVDFFLRTTLRWCLRLPPFEIAQAPPRRPIFPRDVGLRHIS